MPMDPRVVDLNLRKDIIAQQEMEQDNAHVDDFFQAAFFKQRQESGGDIMHADDVDLECFVEVRPIRKQLA